LLFDDDVYHSAASLGTELDGSCGQCKQGVILAATDIYARVEVGTALTHDDLTSIYSLAVVALYSKSL
jgi:hypothetical protein